VLAIQADQHRAMGVASLAGNLLDDAEAHVLRFGFVMQAA
jgi:hypothetical protein